MPKLIEKNQFVFSERVGEGSFDDNWDSETDKADFEILNSAITGAPIFYFKNIRRHVVFDWNELLEKAMEELEKEDINAKKESNAATSDSEEI